jgi:DNA-binding LytR/AlgR family response regulator
MITAIAIDDELPALKVIGNFCEQLSEIRLQASFTRPAEALQYISQSPVDLLFLDIDMPSLSGIELYRSIGQDSMAIFTTAHTEYAVEGFNLNAVDYLLKPFTLERFRQAVNKALEFHAFRQLKDHQGETLLIRADYSLIRVPTSDIVFVEAADDYLRIHQPDRHPLVARMTMKAMLEMLPPKEFIRIHRSYIVAVSHVAHIRNKTISIAGKELPIGGNYEAEVLRLLGR